MLYFRYQILDCAEAAASDTLACPGDNTAGMLACPSTLLLRYNCYSSPAAHGALVDFTSTLVATALHSAPPSLTHLPAQAVSPPRPHASAAGQDRQPAQEATSK